MKTRIRRPLDQVCAAGGWLGGHNYMQNARGEVFPVITANQRNTC